MNSEWHSIGARAELPKDGSGLTVEVGGRNLAVFDHNGRLFAVDDTCPHSGASLGMGVALAGDVTCPWHGFHFALENGRSTDGLELCIATHAIREAADGSVEVALGRAPEVDPSADLR